MNVLSLFDGMSCGQIALRELGIKVHKYFASEIDKHAIAQTQLNFPDTIQLGDVTQVRGSDLPKIDLLIGGSPCQGFSFAGKQLNFKDPRSALFFEYVRILRELKAINPDIKFLFENVRMRKEYELVISNELGLFPVEINSALVSAQNRVRLYWTDIRTRTEGLFSEVFTDIPQPEDKGLLLKDILEPVVEEKYFMSSKVVENLLKHRERNRKNGRGFGIDIRRPENKACALTVGGKYMRDIVQLQAEPFIYQRPRGENKGGFIGGKTPTLTACAWDWNNILCFSSNQAHATVAINKSTPMVAAMGMGGGHVPMIDSGIFRTHKADYGFREIKSGKAGTIPARARQDGSNQNVAVIDNRLRRLTLAECARLQTVPDWYVWNCSDSQIYKMLGNGWTIEVIKHIFSYLQTY